MGGKATITWCVPPRVYDAQRSKRPQRWLSDYKAKHRIQPHTATACSWRGTWAEINYYNKHIYLPWLLCMYYRAKCVVRKILIPTMEGTFCFRPPTPLELPFKGILAYPSPPGMTKHLISMRKIFFSAITWEKSFSFMIKRCLIMSRTFLPNN